MPKLGFRQTAIGAAIAAVAVWSFVLGWLQNDEGSQNARKTDTVSEWTPIKPKTLDLAADAKTLTSKLPFGVPAQPGTTPSVVGPGPTPQPQWRIGGVVITETRRYLVLLIREPGQNADQPEKRQVGDQLPDGGIVRAVEPGSITVDRGGSIVTIKMFAQK
jgi:hypothetical protein